METAIITALITAFTSLIVSLFQSIQSQRNQKELEVVKSRIAEQQAERDARRDYEYKALQRLYEEYEPLRFQLLEAVENATSQIEAFGKMDALIQQGREGLLPGGNYFLLASIYHLLRPAAVYHIAQRKLTLVDLKIDLQIELQYLLMKKAYLALSHDALIAEASGLDYTPYVEGWREKREVDPPKFRRQGLPLGRLDNAIVTLIGPLAPDTHYERIISFGEFENRFGLVEDGDVRSGLGAARDLFFKFHPLQRPVLWRILLAQYLLYKAILKSVHEDIFSVTWLEQPRELLTHHEIESLSLQTSTESSPEDLTFESTIAGVEKYLQGAVIDDVKHIYRRKDVQAS